MEDDRSSILSRVFFYTCPVKGENYYWPHGVTCSFFLIEKDLQLEDTSFVLLVHVVRFCVHACRPVSIGTWHVSTVTGARATCKHRQALNRREREWE